MKFQSIAASLATLIFAASPSMTAPARTDAMPAAQSAVEQPKILVAQDDTEDPGSEDRFIDTWFPAVKPEEIG